MHALTPPTPEPSLPLLVAHRGASAEAPENTLAAFELALAQGADGIELDVHLSADRHPVVIHDFTLERTTDGAGPVNAHRMAELKRLDAGGWRDRRFRGQRLQTLQEVLERFRTRARFWIGLRGGSALYPGIEERVVSMLEVYEVVDRSLVQSWDRQALARIRDLNREVRVGALVARPPVDPELLRTGAVNAICPSAHLCVEPVVRRIREAGLECYARTVDEPAQVDRLVGWGVTGIITSRPGALRARIGRQREISG